MMLADQGEVITSLTGERAPTLDLMARIPDMVNTETMWRLLDGGILKADESSQDLDIAPEGHQVGDSVSKLIFLWM